MKDELVSYETAVLAKEKGFNIKGVMYYDLECELSSFNDFIGDTLIEQREFTEKFMDCEAPTQSLLQRWLREKHRLEINISKDSYDIYHCMVVGDIEIKGPFYDHVYEKALEQGLQEALKLIKD